MTKSGTASTIHDFARGDRVHVEGWGTAEFVVTGHIWWRELVSVEIPEGGISGHEPPARLTKIHDQGAVSP